MNWPSDADMMRLLQYCRRHSPEYLIDVYTAAIERRIELGLILRDGPEILFEGDRPYVTTVSDDIGRTSGPGGFNPATLIPAVNNCGAVSVITAPPERRFYLDALAFALQQQRNVLIVETTADQESVWLKFLVETNTTVTWGLWSGTSTGAEQ